jgi:FkbH-like protein
LHDGVLGEDGVNGVSINHEFRELQKRILKLKESGIFLILISKNEHKDVKQLFAARTDYPLQWDDFSVIKASWDSKAKAIAQAAKELNISTDAILFIDDNIGELNHVASHCQAVHILHASSATNTTRAIQFYPGLWRWQSSHDASLRIADMKANRLRNELKSSLLSESDYFKSLEVRLTIRYDDRQNITRLAELCEKTNQFNLAISRFNQTQIQNFMHSQNMSVISIALSDRLSDSGTIAVMVTEKNKETLIVREACISCRALGRNLENDIILSALKHVRFIHHCTAISLIYNKGERNQPAKKWLDETLSVLGNKETLMMDKTKLLAYQPGEGLLLNIGEDSWTSSK